MPQPSTTNAGAPLRFHSLVYTPAAYTALFGYAQRLLLTKFVTPDAMAASLPLARELYAPQLDFTNLLDIAKNQLARVYHYDAAHDRTYLADLLATAPVFLRDTDPRLTEAEIATTFMFWLRDRHPEIAKSADAAQLVTGHHALERLGRQELGYQVDNFIQSVYDGLTMLHVLPHLTGEYATYAYDRQVRYEQGGSHRMNVGLWHAHVLSAGLWALNIDTAALDQMLTDALDRNIDPDFARLT